MQPSSSTPVPTIDDEQAIARDVAAVGRIGAVPALLRLICQNTGMGFAAVARVTDGSWTACAVQDNIAFGLLPGAQLDIETTLCREARADRQPVVIDHASQDPVYRDHHTPRIYNIESYISVPIVRPGGEYFGNLCAIDPRPARISDARTVAMFTSFADLIAMQLEDDDRQEQTASALASERATAELREQFIAVLGHDLRNPLGAVGAAGELLRRRPEPDLAKLGERLRSSTRRMSALIDDVLDFARGRLGSARASVSRLPRRSTWPRLCATWWANCSSRTRAAISASPPPSKVRCAATPRACSSCCRTCWAMR